MSARHPMVPRSRRNRRCQVCGSRIGVCSGCEGMSEDRAREIEDARKAKVAKLRAKLDPGCLALREANIDDNEAAKGRAA